MNGGERVLLNGPMCAKPDPIWQGAFIRAFLQKDDDPRLPELLARGHRALGVMEQHLATRDYFVGGRLSLADLALFAYTHRAGDGGFDLAAFPAVRAWLARCRAQPGVSEMPTR